MPVLTGTPTELTAVGVSWFMAVRPELVYPYGVAPAKFHDFSRPPLSRIQCQRAIEFHLSRSQNGQTPFSNDADLTFRLNHFKRALPGGGFGRDASVSRLPKLCATSCMLYSDMCRKPIRSTARRRGRACLLAVTVSRTALPRTDRRHRRTARAPHGQQIGRATQFGRTTHTSSNLLGDSTVACRPTPARVR